MNTLTRRLAPLMANMLFIAVTLGIFHIEFFKGYDFIREESLRVIAWVGAIYFLIALPYYLFKPLKKIKPSKGLLALYSIQKYFTKKKDTITHEEKTALLFIIVKFVFLPLMLNFLFGHLDSIIPTTQTFWTNLQNVGTLSAFNTFFFPYIVSIIFFIDVAFFTFGYIFEHEKLDNVVRSVEPTFFGWFVTLACYPPFNSGTVAVIGWYASDLARVPSPTLMFTLNMMGVLCLIVYVAATIALGTKCSNLTNRGIVARGPYAWIRHPAYISKNLSWWLTVIPSFNIFAIVSMAAWSLIYYARAITEENHLMMDPDYQKYVKQVKYKFIPGVW